MKNRAGGGDGQERAPQLPRDAFVRVSKAGIHDRSSSDQAKRLGVQRSKRGLYLFKASTVLRADDKLLLEFIWETDFVYQDGSWFSLVRYGRRIGVAGDEKTVKRIVSRQFQRLTTFGLVHTWQRRGQKNPRTPRTVAHTPHAAYTGRRRAL